MRHQTDTLGNIIVKPTRQDVETLQMGDFALDCFGKWSRVESIFHRGEDIHGKLFVCFRVDFGNDGSTITASAKEDEFVATVPLTREYSTSTNYPWKE